MTKLKRICMGEFAIGMVDLVIDKKNALGTYMTALVTRKFVSTCLPESNQMKT